MTIRNIGLVNGRTKVANLMVNNIGVDITVNQTGEEILLTMVAVILDSSSKHLCECIYSIFRRIFHAKQDL
jgi:hypothetical protein